MGHWYTKDRESMYEIAGKDGTMRDTTLRDARKLNLFPSVTTIIGQLDKPGLNAWLQGEVCKATLANPIEKGELLKDWILRIKKISKEVGESKAKIGTDIHDAIESIWRNDSASIISSSGEYTEIAARTVEAIINHCNTDEFEPEQVVIGSGYGGKVDLHNEDFVIDYKTKDITDEEWDKIIAGKPKKMAYASECMQLSAYRAALPPGATRLLNVFVDRTVAGRVYIYEHTENMYSQFQCLVGYWQMDKKYIPEQ